MLSFLSVNDHEPTKEEIFRKKSCEGGTILILLTLLRFEEARISYIISKRMHRRKLRAIDQGRPIVSLS